MYGMKILRHHIPLLLFAFTILVSCRKDSIDPGQAESFIKLFGSSSWDDGADVRQLPDGEGFIILGTTPRETGDLDLVLVQTDRYGNQDWFEYFGGAGDDVGNCIQLTADGGLILLGTTGDPVNGETDILLVKIRPGTAGETEWTRTIGGAGNQTGAYLQPLADGYIFTGSTDENGDQDILVVRTNLEGEVLGNATSWYVAGGYNALTGNGLDDAGTFIAETADGYGFLIVGTATPGASASGREIIVVAMSANGVGWSNITFGGDGTDEGTALVHISGNEYLVAGTGDSGGTQSAIIQQITVDRENLSLSGNGMIRFNLNGNSLGLSSFCPRPDGGYVLAGSVLTSPGNSDIYVSVTDGTGQPLAGSAQIIGGSGNEYAQRIIPVSDGGYAVIGSTGIPEDNNRMITLIKLNRNASLQD